MRKRMHGLSLLEMLISFQIILMVALYCMSMFAQGQNHFVRAQEYSDATLLANQKMQNLLVQSLPTIKNAVAKGTEQKFVAPFDDYLYNLSLSPFSDRLGHNDPLLSILTVEVHSRQGAVARAVTLVSDEQRFLGVAVDSSTSTIAFAEGVAGSSANAHFGLAYDHDPTDKSSPGLSLKLANPDLGGGAPVGGLAGNPGAGPLWTASLQSGAAYFNGTAWSPGFLTAPGAVTPEYTAVATDQFTSLAFVGDAANRGIWMLRDPGSGAAPSFAPQLMKPTVTPMGAPSGVATDAFGTVVWVADRENQCLRSLAVGAAATGYTDPDASGQGWWTAPITLPGVVGSLQGVALDPDGSKVYVVDRSHLYRYDVNSAAFVTVVTFPTAMTDAGPSGLAFDPYGNVFYINCTQGQLWKFKPGTAPVELW